MLKFSFKANNLGQILSGRYKLNAPNHHGQPFIADTVVNQCSNWLRCQPVLSQKLWLKVHLLSKYKLQAIINLLSLKGYFVQ